MHNHTYYQSQSLCTGLHLPGTDCCSASLFNMEELFNAQYFFSFPVLTCWFWIKSADKRLNFSSEGIFSGPWIICELFHNFSNPPNNIVNAGNMHIFFNIQNNLAPFSQVCLFGHRLEHVLWKEKPDLPKIVTADAQAHPPKKLFEIMGPPSTLVCTVKAHKH